MCIIVPAQHPNIRSKTDDLVGSTAMPRDSSTSIIIIPDTEESPDEQDAASEEELGAFKDLAYEDNDVKEFRHPDTPINNHNDLTRREKVALMGLLAGHAVWHEGHEVEGTRRQPYREFFRLVFRDWSSEDDIGARPQWRGRSFHDTSVKVGVLATDHPTTRRRVNQPPDSNAPLIPPFVIETLDIPTKSKHRKAGRPVYLLLTLDPEDEWCSWLLCDQGRQEVNSKYVTFNAGLNREETRNRVTKHYDHREKARITAWNREVVIFLARRRIVKWARDGSVSGGHVVGNDRLGPGVIQKLVFAQEIVQKCKAFMFGRTDTLPPVRLVLDF